MIIRSPLQVPNASRCLPRKYLSGSLNSPTMTESSSMRRPRSSVHRAREHILEKAARVRCYSWSFDSKDRNTFLTSSKSSWNECIRGRPVSLSREQGALFGEILQDPSLRSGHLVGDEIRLQNVQELPAAGRRVRKVPVNPHHMGVGIGDELRNGAVQLPLLEGATIIVGGAPVEVDVPDALIRSPQYPSKILSRRSMPSSSDTVGRQLIRCPVSRHMPQLSNSVWSRMYL